MCVSRGVAGLPAYLLLVQLEGGLDQIPQGGQLLLLLVLSLFDLRRNKRGRVEAATHKSRVYAETFIAPIKMPETGINNLQTSPYISALLWEEMFLYSFVIYKP